MGRPSKGERRQVKGRIPEDLARELSARLSEEDLTLTDWLRQQAEAFLARTREAAAVVAVVAASVAPAVSIAVVEGGEIHGDLPAVSAEVLQAELSDLPRLLGATLLSDEGLALGDKSLGPVDSSQGQELCDGMESIPMGVIIHDSQSIMAAADLGRPESNRGCGETESEDTMSTEEPKGEDWIEAARKRHEARQKEALVPGSLAWERARVETECRALGVSTHVPDRLPKGEDAIGYLKRMIVLHHSTVEHERQLAEAEAREREERAAQARERQRHPWRRGRGT